MKYRCCITVLIVIAMIVVLSFSGYFMFEITSVLKSKGENFSSNMPIGMICSYQNTSSPVCLLNLESKSQDESIIKAYDSLCNELSSWMSIMGVFSVVFGLLIPIGSYLLQHNSIIDEKREIERKNKEDIIKVKRKIEEKTESILRPMWLFLSNWNAGRYGKFRVIAVAVVVVLAFKGLFFGWGESENLKIAKMQKEAAEMEAGAAVWGALLGGGGASQSSSSHSSGPQKKTWMCAQCGNQVQGTVPPSFARCRAYHGQRDGSCKEKCNWRQVR